MDAQICTYVYEFHWNELRIQTGAYETTISYVFLFHCIRTFRVGFEPYSTSIKNKNMFTNFNFNLERLRALSRAFTSSVRSVHDPRRERSRVPSGTYWGPIDKYLLHCIRTLRTGFELYSSSIKNKNMFTNFNFHLEHSENQ